MSSCYIAWGKEAKSSERQEDEKQELLESRSCPKLQVHVTPPPNSHSVRMNYHTVRYNAEIERKATTEPKDHS